jgi:hypothetical protein
MRASPRIIALSENVYRKLLRVFPRDHRRDYSHLMAQLFRDQCRDAYRERRSLGLIRLWLRTLPDLGKNSLLEQLERKQIMFNPQNRPLLLLLAGLALGFLSFAFTQSPEFLRLLVAASALAILAKAFLELFRPSSEWKRFAIGSAVLLFIYAIFMPAWAKADHGVPDSFKIAIMACLFANPIVALLKLVQFALQRPRN